MRTAERDITEAQRSIFAGLGMITMAGVVAFQGAHNPGYRPYAYVFTAAWIGLAGVNFNTATKIVHRLEDPLPFQNEPVLSAGPMPDTSTLAKQIGLEG